MRTFLTAAFIVAFWCAFWFMVGIATAHQAQPTAAKPYGWDYPLYCCSGKDCAMLTGKMVIEGPNGYVMHLNPGDHPMVIKPMTVNVPYGDSRIKDSPDGEFHLCLSQTHESPDGSAIFGGNVLCFFVPPRSF